MSSIINAIPIGYLAIFVSAFGFGSNFVPVKKCSTGDGLFFQFIFCSAVLTMGTVVGFYQGFGQFYATAMLGGALWATGNILCVPCIKLIGLALGLCTWGATNMLVGWASGTFGLLGYPVKDTVSNINLNYAGVGCSLIALLLYASVQPQVKAVTEEVVTAEDDPESALMNNNNNGKGGNPPKVQTVEYEQGIESGMRSPIKVQSPKRKSKSKKNDDEEVSLAKVVVETSSSGGEKRKTSVDSAEESDELFPTLPQPVRRFIGIMCGLISGAFFGTSFNPVMYVRVKENLGEDFSNLNFVFPHFCGAFLTALFWFLLYCAYMQIRGKTPALFPKAVLPAFLSGGLWACANIAWFVANEDLGQAIAFPIVTSTPNIVGSAWGVFVFKEISGKGNLIRLSIALCFTVACGVLIALSK